MGEAGPVDRHVHQASGLDAAVAVLLQQDHLAGQRRQSGIPRLLHCLAPHRFGIHVIAEGAQIAVPERLEVDDGGIGIARSRRTDVILRETLPAQRGDMLGLLRRRHDQRKANPLDAGKMLRQLQRVDVVFESVAVGGGSGGKQAAGAVQDFFVVQHALGDAAVGFMDAELEFRLLLFLGVSAGILPEPADDHQENDQHHPGNQPLPPKPFLDLLHSVFPAMAAAMINGPMSFAKTSNW